MLGLISGHKRSAASCDHWKLARTDRYSHIRITSVSTWPAQNQLLFFHNNSLKLFVSAHWCFVTSPCLLLSPGLDCGCSAVVFFSLHVGDACCKRPPGRVLVGPDGSWCSFHIYPDLGPDGSSDTSMLGLYFLLVCCTLHLISSQRCAAEFRVISGRVHLRVPSLFSLSFLLSSMRNICFVNTTCCAWFVLQMALCLEFKSWGVQMERVELKALTPPVDLQRCMASEAVSQIHGDIYPYIHIQPHWG